MWYNYRKMQVMMASKVCLMRKVPPTCEMLAELVGVDREMIWHQVGRYMRYGDFTRRTVGRTRIFAYVLSKKGTRTLEQYLDRYHRGLSLNLKWNPKPVDFKDGGKPLPGLVLHDTDVNEKEKRL